ncbi:MAG: OmpA family protein [Phycisphaerae bacterium]|nr:OmpA family protein [Phycisphaerae bacterium]
MRSRLWMLTAVLSAATLVGCNNKEKDEVAMLKDRNAELQSELDRSKSALEGSESSRRSLEEETSRARAAAEAAQANAATGAMSGPGGGASPALPKDLPPGVTARVEGNSIVLDIPGDVLFDAGKATLKSDAKKTLDQVAKSVKASYPGKKLSVEGFTDADPISKSKKNFADNWELGYERARAVGKYLVGKGFTESQFRYVTYGATEPKTSKKSSRRVEISIVDAS